MPSRFDEAPEKSPVLTPQLTEAVVRQAERRRAEAAERERIAEARVQGLADRLGLPPDEVRRMAEEEARRLAAPAPKPRFALSRGALHASYLAALVVVGAWGYAGRAVSGRPLSLSPIPLGSSTTPSVVHESVVIDRSLVTPPTGLKLSVVDERNMHTLVGMQGKTPLTPASAKVLKASIRSFLKWKEANYGTMLAFKQTGFTSPVTNAFKAYPAPGGWHALRITDGSTTVAGNVPDGRFASNFKDFERELAAALDDLVDKQLFPQIAKEVPVRPEPDPTPTAPATPVPLTKRIAEGFSGLRGGRP